MTKIDLKQITKQLNDLLGLEENVRVAAMIDNEKDNEIVGWCLTKVDEDGNTTVISKAYNSIKEMLGDRLIGMSKKTQFSENIRTNNKEIIMTNEEMAKSLIASKPLSSMITTADFEKAVVEMAAWKDEQFKTKIEELFKALEKEGYNDSVKSGFDICAKTIGFNLVSTQPLPKNEVDSRF